MIVLDSIYSLLETLYSKSYAKLNAWLRHWFELCLFLMVPCSMKAHCVAVVVFWIYKESFVLKPEDGLKWVIYPCLFYWSAVLQ